MLRPGAEPVQGRVRVRVRVRVWVWVWVRVRARVRARVRVWVIGERPRRLRRPLPLDREQ